LDVIYIQAKRWQNTVGRPDIQQFVGALAGKGAKKGVFITTSKFSEQAKSYRPADIKVVLIDGEQLANYAIDVNLGVSVICEYQITLMANNLRLGRVSLVLKLGKFYRF
jgi:restriction system protein